MEERIELLVLRSKGHGKGIDTLRGRKFLPGQRVQLAGEKEVYTLLWVDTQRHSADLLHDGAVRKLEIGIHLSLLRVVSAPDVDEEEISA